MPWTRKACATGIDRELVDKARPMDARSDDLRGRRKFAADLEEVTRLGQGKIDLTIGSALTFLAAPA